MAAALAGLLAAFAQSTADHRDCRREIADGVRLDVQGWVSELGPGLVLLDVREGLGECKAPVRVRVRGGELPSGAWARAVGWWRVSPGLAGEPALRAGTLIVERLDEGPSPRVGVGAGLRSLSLRGQRRVRTRIDAIFADRAPLIQALLLARKEGVPAEVRTAFARSGTAHMLAISGFHVGLVGGLVAWVLLMLGLRPRSRWTLMLVVVWAYVLWIGFPHAAARAALLVTFTAVAQARGRPASPLGLLGSALLVLLLLDSTSLGSIGFQLSFAGAYGLIAIRPALVRAMGGRWEGSGSASPARRLRGILVEAVAASTAAALATAPLVAWHFGEVPLLSIPATLATSPLVVVVMIGVLLTLLTDLLAPGAAFFLAGGTGVLIDAWVNTATFVSGLPAATAWVGKEGLAGALVALLIGALPLRRWLRSPGLRGVALFMVALVGVLLAPLAPGVRRGVLDIHVLDVGQGDALAVRTPRGRWLLVDAGPRSTRWDAGTRVVLPFLRGQGVTSLAGLILTHPDLDHIGGASSVLEGVRVGVVVDPGRAAGRDPYVDLLRRASDGGVPWRRAAAGAIWEVDDVEIRVLWPPAAGDTLDANDASVVLSLRFGEFSALLTGDASEAVERAILDGLPPEVHLLKVGHHGSATSTSSDLLNAVRPEVAAISVGRGNRYGHPDPAVLARLRRAGAWILRTDVSGSIHVRARSNGTFRVRVRRP